MGDDLARAVHAAVLGVRALRESLEEAQERCDEAAGRIDKLTNTLEADRKALHDAVEELDTSVQEATKLVSDQLPPAESGFTDVGSACRELGIEGLQVLDVEAMALDEMAQQVRALDPRVAALAEAAETASRAALERATAVTDELGRLVDEAEELLTTEMAAALAQAMEEIEKAAAEVHEVIDHQCPQLLLDKETEFGARMSEAEDLVNRVFPDMERHADEVAQHTLETLARLAKEQMDDIEAESRTLEGELENLTSLASEKKDGIENAGQGIVNAMHDNGEAVKTVEQALSDVRGRWVLFGFAV